MKQIGMTNIYLTLLLVLVEGSYREVSSHYKFDPMQVRTMEDQDQDQETFLVKHRNYIHSPGPVIREISP